MVDPLHLQKVVNQGKDICTAPVFRSKPDLEGGFLEGGFWKYNTKPSNILPHYGENDEDESDEKHTIQDDVIVSGQDVAAGLIRMGILPRICSLLEVIFLPFFFCLPCFFYDLQTLFQTWSFVLSFILIIE
jgi:hypothetical protein